MSLTDKQKKVFEFIQQFEIIQGKSPTQKEIKEFMGLKSFGSVQKYLQYLKAQGLIDKEWNARRGIKLSESEGPKEDSTISIPILGQVAAGLPLLAFENYEEQILIPKELLGIKNKSISAKYFALKVKGESMIEAHIRPGDFAICEKIEKAANGSIVVALIDDEATLKYFYQFPHGIELRPANPHFEVIKIKAQEFSLLGCLKALWRIY